MRKKVAVLHTSLVLYDMLGKLLGEIMPDADVMNIIEDTLLKDVIASNGLTPEITKRICGYVLQAEAAGADVVLNACSSVSEAIDTARKLTRIPCVKIDEAMAEEAVELGGRIAVFGTVGTTLSPSARLVEAVASLKGKKVEVRPYLIDGAFKVLAEEKNPEKHNRMVLDTIRRVGPENDVLILAQASMTILMPHLQDMGKPVLYSARSGVERVKKVLEHCR